MRKLICLFMLVGILAISGTAIVGCTIPHVVYETPVSIEDGAVHINVVRESKFVGGGVEYYIMSDGRVIATVPNGTNKEITIKPGEYAISVSDGKGQLGKSSVQIFKPNSHYRITVYTRAFSGGDYAIDKLK